MEFAGNDLIYLSKKKKEKIKKLKIEEESREAPVSKPKKDENEDLNSEDSDDTYISVDSNNFNIDLERSNMGRPINLMAAPGIKFKKAIDTNACVIRFNSLEKEPENIVTKLYKCEKCNSYLNQYSILKPLLEKDKYEWKCEFCFHLNKNIYIDKNNLPKSDCCEKCILKPQIEKEENKADDDSSLIFCLDNSGSMDANYRIDEKLKEKFNKIREYKSGNISRLEMVKIAIENIINSLLKKSPKVKVGLVNFESKIEVKGDCLSNIMIIKENDMNNETKLISLGKENTNLIKSEINKSYQEIIKSLRGIETGDMTALGPAALLSLYLLDKAKNGSRIFLCTDGQSNEGVGSVYNRENAIQFYTKIGKIANEKDIVISLIAFLDCESEIDILKHMVGWRYL